MNKAKDLISILVELIKTLRYLRESLKYPNTHKDGLVVFALTKAETTCSAILVLINAQHGTDSAMLNRSLFELCVGLEYILKDQTNAMMDRFLAYDAVESADMISYFEKDETKLKMLEEPEFIAHLGSEGVEGVKKRAVVAKEKYGYKPGYSWSDNKIKGMAESVGLLDMYDTIYRMESQLIHLSPKAMNEYITVDERGVLPRNTSEGVWIKESLVPTIHLCIRIINAASAHTQIDVSTRIVEQVNLFNRIAAS